MYWLLALPIILTLAYLGALIVLEIGFSRLRNRQKTATPHYSENNLPTVSVIVAARNEGCNLPHLLSCLKNLDYPEDKLEICIANDRSEDATADLLEAAKREMKNLRVLHITTRVPNFAPKKRAIDLAMKNTRGEIILLTDADCTPPPTWVRSVVAHYQPSTTAVIAYAPYRFDTPMATFLKGILSLDYFSVTAVSSAAVGFNEPATAAGCNLSYRRSTYQKAKGFEGISKWISGDDDLFILKVAQQNLGTFNFACDPKSFVPAAGPASLRTFWNQRVRYASKGRHYAPQMVAALSSVYLFNAWVFLGSLSLLISPTLFGWIALGSWLLKSLFEFHFLHKVTSVFKENFLMRYYLPTALLHPAYVIVFGFLGLFAPFDWHGELFSVTTPEEAYSKNDG